MKNVTPTISKWETNSVTFDLGGTIKAVAVSYGETDRQSPHHEITISFVDTETGDKPNISLNGIDYNFWYATGRVYADRRAQATQAELRRSEGGYFGTPPTEKARSEAWGLVRELLELIVQDDNFGPWLDAGEQKKRYRKIEHLQTEINNLKDEYAKKISELYEAVDEAGNLNDFDLNFPHPEWVSR